MSYLPNPNGLRFSPNMGLGGGVMAAPTPQAQPNLNPYQYSLTGGAGVQAPSPSNLQGTAGPVLPPAVAAVMGNAVNGFNSGLQGNPLIGPPPNPAHVASNPFYIGGRSVPGIGTNLTQLHPFQQSGFANLTNKLAAEQPKPIQKPTEAVSNYWGGGFGKSDNSAWGNALGPTLETKTGANPLQVAGNQPSGHTNNALPPGYGSVFGLGGK